jgi:hypothetical protein
LPRIEAHAQVAFHHVRCPHRQADYKAEMVAFAWRWFVRASHRGKDVTQFPSVLASYAARHVRSGRKLCGQEKARDVLSPRAQRLKGFTLSSLPDGSSPSGNVMDAALRDNTQTPVPDQVAFRLDFPAWLNTLSERDRRVVEDLMLGERTGAVAAKYGLSPARVSQLRRQFLVGWRLFCGEPDRHDAPHRSLVC